MKTILLLTACLGFTLRPVFIMAADRVAIPSAGEPRQILMIGNSLTYTYGLPKMLEAIAGSRGKPLKITLHIAGGKGLEWHLIEPVKGATAPEAIAKGNYDVVVLQGNVPSISKGEGGPEKFAEAVQKLHGFIAASGRAKTLLYTGFVRKSDVTEEQISAVMKAYTDQARALPATCAPVALAFQRFAAAHPDIALLDNEVGRRYALDKVGTHQSPFGSYLAACVIFSALYDETSVGSEYRKLPDGTEISEADAALAQKAAWVTWTEYKASLKGG